MQSYILDTISIPEDLEFLYNVMNAEDQYLHSTKLQFWSVQMFEQWIVRRLQTDFHDFYIVKDPNTKIRKGYVYNYDFSLKNGNCKLAVYICPEYRATGIGAFAAIGFIKKLFDMYPIQKLYSTIYDYNGESLRSNLAAGFVEEGILKDYRYYNGKMHDIHYLSLSRQQFEYKMRKWVERCFV